MLHLKDNPSAGRLAGQVAPSSLPMDELKRLRQENQSLKEAANAQHQNTSDRSDNKECSPDQSLNLSVFPAGNATTIQTASKATQEADMMKLNQRLKEMFKERITSYREAVYLLTGYKVMLSIV